MTNAITERTANTALVLRPYQVEAVSAVEKAWDSGRRAVSIVIPTGGGKTVTSSNIVARHLAAYPGKVLIIAHRRELLDQFRADLMDNIPGLRVGTVVAGMNETFARVIVASVATLAQPGRLEQLGSVSLIITDECHHATAPSYRRIYDYWPEARMLGVTATHARSDGKPLGDVWEDIAYEYKLMDAIRAGYLVDVKGIKIEVPNLDLSKVKKQLGDYSNSSLGEAIEASLAPTVVAKAFVEHAGSESAILFAPTVETAFMFAAELMAVGIRTGVVHGGMRKEDRAKVIADLRHGRIQVVCNCMVLTEGTNIPRVSVIGLARPTRSQMLGIQMVGRGMRLYPGKERCLVLDMSGQGADDELSLFSVSTLAGKPVKPGLSILESEDEGYEPEERTRRDKPIHDGDTVARDFDPLAAGRLTWRQTPAGFWYVADERRFVFILPGAEPDTFDVGWRATRGPINGKNADIAFTGISSISMAMARSESEIEISGYAKARKSKARVTDKMHNYALSLGIEVTPFDNQGTVGEKITAQNAISSIDAVFMPWIIAEGRDMTSLGGAHA